MKELQSPWKWIVISIPILCLGALLIIACTVLWETYVERATTADQEAQATIAALATENVHLAAQMTLQVTPATLIAPSAIPTSELQPAIAPSGTPQPTATPTITSQPTTTPTTTLQPASQPTSVPDRSLQILSFSGNPDPVARGGTITLTWNAPGMASAGITRLSPEGDIFLEPEALDLPASGSIAVQVPEEYTEQVKYYFGAREANGALHKAYVTIGILCRYDEYLAPRCPLTKDAIWAAYEPFEHGLMVWRSDTQEIYVLYADGSYETYEDTWREGDPVHIPGTPTPGLHAPVRGFGNLYGHQQHVRQGLGWATALEAGYTMRVETIRGGSGRYPGISTYFTLPDNQVVNLYSFTSTWEINA